MSPLSASSIRVEVEYWQLMPWGVSQQLTQVHHIKLDIDPANTYGNRQVFVSGPVGPAGLIWRETAARQRVWYASGMRWNAG